MEIIITDSDRKLYGLINSNTKNESLVLQTEQDKYVALSRPIDLPRIPTVYDLKIENKLSESDKLVLADLSKMYQKFNFDNITPQEAIEIQNHSTDIKSLSREEIWKAIKPFFNSVFNRDLGDLTSKMTEIARRLDNDPNHLPTMEWLTIIAERILHSRIDLYQYNIDLKARMFNHCDNPIETLLMLMKVQKEMYPKRNKKLSDTYFSKFILLMQSHSELMIKLKIKNQKGEDFFGSKYDKIRASLRVLKGISYISFGGKPLTMAQQTSLLNIIDDYKKTLEMIFLYNPDDKILFNEPLVRPIKDERLASLEVYHSFDDSPNGEAKYRFNKLNTQKTCSEIINSIFIGSGHNKQMTMIYKNQ